MNEYSIKSHTARKHDVRCVAYDIVCGRIGSEHLMGWGVWWFGGVAVMVIRKVNIMLHTIL